MATFLLIDPAAGRRAGLRVFLQPPHEVVECSSFGESLTAGAEKTFKAAFIAWPEGARPAVAGSPTWSCEHVALLLADPAQVPGARDWCKKFFLHAQLTLMRCADGYLNSPEISRALSRILDTPEVAFPEMVGSSAAMRQLLELAARVAANDRPVLIAGEPGTGKEALARWIHARSARGQRPFEPFDSSGLEPAAAFSELFGHEKGAFPWAAQARRGLLAAANEGTLYIREVCGLDKALQSKLLRLLERPAVGFERLGGQETHQVDVRLVAGSCRHPSERLGEEFSPDLYYRLRHNYLETPPLRSRPSDIPELARYLLATHHGIASHSLNLEPRALSALQRYQWPGNLNELEEVVAEAALKTNPGGEIRFEHLPPRIRNAAEQAGLAATPLPASDSRPPPNPPDLESSFPETGFCYDGYRMLEIIASPLWSRVFLARRETGDRLRVVKFSQARNRMQTEAVEKIMALADKDLEAKRFMIPIDHADNCSEGPWYMVVLACLDDWRYERQIDQHNYQPHTFHAWITNLRRDRSLSHQDQRSVLEHLETILGALECFHRNGLLMNDVKPSNFGFFENRLVAIDYGGFTFLGDGAHEVTAAYSLPPGERRDGQPAEDVYAVVKMMAEALYGVPPETLQPNTVESLAKPYHREGRLFDRDGWHIIGKGLHPNPSFRFRDARAMFKALEELKQLLKEDPQGGNATAPVK